MRIKNKLSSYENIFFVFLCFDFNKYVSDLIFPPESLKKPSQFDKNELLLLSKIYM